MIFSLMIFLVTENEITKGILDKGTRPDETSVCIIRKIIDIEDHLDDFRAEKFTDKINSQVDSEAKQLLQNLRDSRLSHMLPENNVTKLDIEWHASGASISIENKTNVAKEDGSDGVLIKHKNYLNSICDQFFTNVARLVSSNGRKHMKLYDDWTVEVLQHLHFARSRCEVFEGREDVIKAVKSYLDSSSRLPYVIYGKSGCGKTSVMAKIFENMSEWSLKSKKASEKMVHHCDQVSWHYSDDVKFTRSSDQRLPSIGQGLRSPNGINRIKYLV